MSETGIGASIGSGSTWYVSAMLVGMLLLFPILSKTANNKFFACVYAPVFSCFIYAFLKARYGSTQANSYIMTADATFMVLPNLMRATAGLMLGCFIYSITGYCDRNKINKEKLYVFKIMELLLLMLVFLGIMQKTSFSKWDFVEIFCFVFILLIATCFPCGIKNNRIKRIILYLRKLTLPMYLFQEVSGYVIKILSAYNVNSYPIRTVVFWVTILGMSVISLYLVEHIKTRFKCRSVL